MYDHGPDAPSESADTAGGKRFPARQRRRGGGGGGSEDPLFYPAVWRERRLRADRPAHGLPGQDGLHGADTRTTSGRRRAEKDRRRDHRDSHRSEGIFRKDTREQTDLL